jgi:alanine dehydrogenase
VTSIAYETVQLPDGTLPLLAPMSEVAGRMAPQVGAHHLQRDGGGRGVLMGGVSGVYAAKVVVLGAGVSGMNAAAIALGMQAEVLLLDKNVARLRSADAIYQGHCQTVTSNTYEVERAVIDADLVIGAVLVPGAKAPKLVSDDLVARMKPGAVLVDISIDQGGCFEGSRPTTHAEPTYKVHDALFYCVANMPGAVPHTSTYALTNVTLPYAIEIANNGWRAALKSDKALAQGLSTHAGALTSGPVAEAHGLPFTPIPEVLN